MTERREIERVLDRWFVEGPTQVADRVVMAALEIVDHTAQPRAWRRLWRISPMNQGRLVAAAAALVVVIGGGAILALGLRAPSSGNGCPSLAPEPSMAILGVGEMSACVTYRAVSFDPPLTITGRQGWYLIVPTTRGTAFFESGGPGAFGPLPYFSVSVVDPTQVLPVGATTGQALPTDLIAWLQGQSELSLSAPTTTQVGGMPARVIEGTVQPTAKLNSDDNVILMCWDTPCEPESGGALAVQGGYHFEIFVVDVRGKTVVIRADSPEATWAKGHKEVDDFLATIHFPA